VQTFSGCKQKGQEPTLISLKASAEACYDITQSLKGCLKITHTIRLQNRLLFLQMLMRREL